MRTAKEIRRWLERRKWYGSFRTQVWKACTGDRIFSEQVLSGEFGRDTISSGFNWWQSDEGAEFWSRVNDKFREWYEKEGK